MPQIHAPYSVPIGTALRFVNAPPRSPRQQLSAAVREGLARQPRTLPCRFFYDAVGSEIFEEITRLPEYYPTRTEEALLCAQADEIIQAASGDHSLTLIELGSGSSCKTRYLLDAALNRQESLHYAPIDISGEFLRQSAEKLLIEYNGKFEEMGPLQITAIAGEYHDAVAYLPANPGPRLILFLGSNIGNFEESEAVAFLSHLSRALQPWDRVLVGVDLAKSPEILTPAYNDAAGVTARFNKNLLRRINTEVGADFDLNQWAHHAPWVPKRSRIEMWLVSQNDQIVHLGEWGDVNFAAGEILHTENSHKWTPAQFAQIAESAGLTVRERWTCPNDWFAEFLLAPQVG